MRSPCAAAAPAPAAACMRRQRSLHASREGEESGRGTPSLSCLKHNNRNETTCLIHALAIRQEKGRRKKGSRDTRLGLAMHRKSARDLMPPACVSGYKSTVDRRREAKDHFLQLQMLIGSLSFAF